MRCKVVSDKMDKSCVGKVERRIKHPVVHKYITRSTKLMFHDEKNVCRIGDEVLITPCKPGSAIKRTAL